jgi:hypothetical protein
MKKINRAVLIANILTFLAFIAHTIGGDLEIQTLAPVVGSNDSATKLQIWVMSRCGWHWISFDLLFASIGLFMVNFTRFFASKKSILQLISVYFLGYSIVWIIVLFISPSFEGNFLKLGQWMLILAISGFSLLGSKTCTETTYNESIN